MPNQNAIPTTQDEIRHLGKLLQEPQNWTWIAETGHGFWEHEDSFAFVGQSENILSQLEQTDSDKASDFLEFLIMTRNTLLANSRDAEALALTNIIIDREISWLRKKGFIS